MSDFNFKYIKRFSEAESSEDNKAEKNNQEKDKKIAQLGKSKELLDRYYNDTYGSKAVQVCWLGNRNHDPIDDKTIQQIADELSSKTISIMVQGKGFEKYQINVLDTVYDSKTNYAGLVISKSYIGKDKKKNASTIAKMIFQGAATGGLKGAMSNTAR